MARALATTKIETLMIPNDWMAFYIKSKNSNPEGQAFHVRIKQVGITTF